MVMKSFRLSEGEVVKSATSPGNTQSSVTLENEATDRRYSKICEEQIYDNLQSPRRVKAKVSRKSSNKDNSESERKAMFIMDSGCSHHVTNDLSILDNVVHCGNVSDLGRISGCVPGISVRVLGYGAIKGLGVVLYAPNIARSLISVSQLDDDDFEVVFKEGKCFGNKRGSNTGINITGKKVRGHYECEIKVRNRGDDISIRTMSDEEARRSRIYGSFYMTNTDGVFIPRVSTTNRENFINKITPVSQSMEILTDPISDSRELIVDSGCSEHMFNTCSYLTNYKSYKLNEKNVVVANGSVISVSGFGKCGILHRVYFVPQLSHSLLSVSSLTIHGVVVWFEDEHAIIVPGKSGLSFDPIRAQKNQQPLQN